MNKGVLVVLAGGLLGFAVVMTAIGADKTMTAVVGAMVPIACLPLILDGSKRKPCTKKSA